MKDSSRTGLAILASCRGFEDKFSQISAEDVKKDFPVGWLKTASLIIVTMA
jgi:hypothetical protein